MENLLCRSRAIEWFSKQPRQQHACHNVALLDTYFNIHHITYTMSSSAWASSSSSSSSSSTPSYLTEDHGILTDHGFLFLDEIVQEMDKRAQQRPDHDLQQNVSYQHRSQRQFNQRIQHHKTHLIQHHHPYNR